VAASGFFGRLAFGETGCFGQIDFELSHAHNKHEPLKSLHASAWKQGSLHPAELKPVEMENLMADSSESVSTQAAEGHSIVHFLSSNL
jgi:hypothetical protein